MSKTEKDLREAFKVRGTPLYHYKGYYTLIVYDYVESPEGDFVLYFNASNCGMDYAEYDGAFIRQAGPTAQLRERFWNENLIRCASVDRMLTKKGKYFKLSLKSPKDPVQMRAKILDHDEDGNLLVREGTEEEG